MPQNYVPRLRVATAAAVVIQCLWLIQPKLFSHSLWGVSEEVIAKSGRRDPMQSMQRALKKCFHGEKPSDECTVALCFVRAGKSDGSRC